jgi:hypothetical protein
MRFFLLTILIGALGFQTSQGRDVKCRFLCFQTQPPPFVTLNSKGEPVPIELGPDEISLPVVCNTDEGSRIALIDPVDLKKAIGAITVPSSAKAVIIIFLPVAANEPPASKMLVIEDTPDKFPDGGAFVANFQPQEIRFTIGEQKLMLKAGATYAVPQPKQVDDFNMAPVVFEFRKDEKWRTARETSQRFLPGIRYLMFCYIDPQNGRPRVSTFEDR